MDILKSTSTFAAFVLLVVSVLSFSLPAYAQDEDAEEELDEMELIDRAAQEAADSLWMPEGESEPEEGDDPGTRWMQPEDEPHEFISQVPRDGVSQPVIESEPSPTSSPAELLRQTRRVQLRELGPGVYQQPSQAPQSSPTPNQAEEPEDGDRHKDPEKPAEKKPGFVRRVFQKVPLIGPRLSGRSEEEKEDEKDKEKEKEREREEEEEQERRSSSKPPAETKRPETEHTVPEDDFAPPPPPPVLYPPPGELTIKSDTLPDEPAAAKEPIYTVPSPTSRPVAPPPTPEGRIITPAPTISRAGAAPVVVGPPSAVPTRPVATDTPAPVAPPSAAMRIDAPKTAAVEADVLAAPSPAPSPEPAAATMLTAAAQATSPTLEANDLSMPNPAVEENEPIRAEFTAAVTAARAGRYGDAARSFRDYAASHPSSRLTPRALFLAYVMETDPATRSESRAILERDHPKSPYIAEMKLRDKDAQPSIPTTPEAIAELEQQLAADPMGPDALDLRRRLGHAFVSKQDYPRAMQVLEPALEVVSGRPEEPEVLDLMAEAYIAQGDNDRAMKLLDEIIRRFTTYRDLPRVRLNMGLANEAAGQYPRAMAEYNLIVQEAPRSIEAKAAQGRIKDLQKLYYQ